MQVHHVEVARRCREEKVTAEAILRLEEVVDELACQRAFLLARRKPCDATRTALANLVPRFERLRAQLRFLASEEEESTGHAFVVFEHELDRNRFYLLFNPPAKAGNVLANASAAAKAVLDLELASPKAVEVARAAVEHAERELREAMASSRVAEGCETFMLETVDSLHYCLGFEKLGDGLVVQAAPEPRDIIWEALELDRAHERVMVLLGTLAILMIVLAGAVVLLAAKIAQAYFGMADLGGWSPVIEPATTLGVMIVTIAFNVIIRMVTVAMVLWEAQDTLALEQSSIFSKLSLGLVTNSVFLPFTTAVLLSGGDVGSQAWYEPGGLIATSALLIVCGYIVDVQNAFHPSAILAKYIHSRLDGSKSARPSMQMLTTALSPPQVHTLEARLLATHAQAALAAQAPRPRRGVLVCVRRVLDGAPPGPPVPDCVPTHRARASPQMDLHPLRTAPLALEFLSVCGPGDDAHVPLAPRAGARPLPRRSVPRARQLDGYQRRSGHLLHRSLGAPRRVHCRAPRLLSEPRALRPTGQPGGHGYGQLLILRSATARPAAVRVLCMPQAPRHCALRGGVGGSTAWS